MPRKENSDSQFTDVAALRPLKLASEFWEVNLTAKGFVCGSGLPLLPKKTVDPIDKEVADVVAISHYKRGKSVKA